MKTVLVGLLILVLGLNSYAQGILAQPHHEPPGNADVNVISTCEIEDVDDQGVFLHSFAFSLDRDSSIKFYSIATTRKKGQGSVASVVRPPEGDVYKLKFGDSLNRDKSKNLELSLRVCLLKKLSASLYQGIIIQQQQMESLVKKMSADQLRAFLAGVIVGGKVAGVDLTNKDSASPNDMGGASNLVVPLEIVNRFNRQGPNQESTLAPGTFADIKGALTPANRNEVLRKSPDTGVRARARAESTK